jgi:hypothetical protein
MTFLRRVEMQKTSVFSDFYCLPNKLALMGENPRFSDLYPTRTTALNQTVLLSNSKSLRFAPTRRSWKGRSLGFLEGIEFDSGDRG